MNLTHWVQPVLPIYIHCHGVILLVATIPKNLSSSSSHQVLMVPEMGWRFVSPSPHHAEIKKNLRISYNVFQNYSAPFFLLTSRSTSTSYPLYKILSFYFIPLNSNLCCPYDPGYLSMVHLPVAIPVKKTDPPSLRSYQLSTAPQWPYQHLPAPCWNADPSYPSNYDLHTALQLGGFLSTPSCSMIECDPPSPRSYLLATAPQWGQFFSIFSTPSCSVL